MSSFRGEDITFGDAGFEDITESKDIPELQTVEKNSHAKDSDRLHGIESPVIRAGPHP